MKGRAEEAVRRLASWQMARFALVGVARTGFSLALYLALLLVVPYWLAFTISFVLGISLSAVLSGRYVFAVGLSTKTFLLYAAVYVVNYLLSLALLWFCVERLAVPPSIAPVIVIVCMFPINFIAERSALLSRRNRV